MYLLGIDAGTEAIKAGVFDVEGNLIASGTQRYATSFPHPGWAEQDPNDWWSGLVGAVHACFQDGTVDPQQIVGISAGATTCTLLPIKANGDALRRALLWMDVRATPQAAAIHQTGHAALRYSIAGVSAEWMPAKALWLKQNEPDIFAETDYLIEYTDWLAFKLTGRLALNINTITQRWYYHTPSGGWPSDFYAAIDLEAIESKFPADVLRLGEIVGGLSSSAAWQLGLPVGIPVAMGGGDAFVGMLGLGVVEPGDLGLVTGSSNVLAAQITHEVHCPGIFGSFPDAVIPGLNLIEGGQVSTGSILSWFMRNFAIDIVEKAQRQGVSEYKLLDAEAEAVALGSDGLIVLDYFQGNRTPHTDSLARGVILGLSLQSDRAHVFRAIMEGVAYGTKDILDTWLQQQCTISRVIACGGATHSRLFMQIYADVLGRPIFTTAVKEASLLGSAVVAAVGAGLYPTLQDAAHGMTRISGEYTPDDERHAQYQFYVQKYRDAYQQTRSTVHDLTRHQSKDTPHNARS